LAGGYIFSFSLSYFFTFLCGHYRNYTLFFRVILTRSLRFAFTRRYLAVSFVEGRSIILSKRNGLRPVILFKRNGLRPVILFKLISLTTRTLLLNIYLRLSQSFDSLPYPSVIGKHNTPTHCYCKSLMYLVLAVCFSLPPIDGVDYGQCI